MERNLFNEAMDCFISKSNDDGIEEDMLYAAVALKVAFPIVFIMVRDIVERTEKYDLKEIMHWLCDNADEFDCKELLHEYCVFDGSDPSLWEKTDFTRWPFNKH